MIQNINKNIDISGGNLDIKLEKNNSSASNRGMSNNSDIIDEVDIRNDNYTVEQKEVLDSIALNFSNNKKVTDIFNHELYNSINNELRNLSMDRTDGRNESR